MNRNECSLGLIVLTYISFAHGLNSVEETNLQKQQANHILK